MGTLGRAIYTVGSWIRGTGQAIDRLGSRFHGGYYIEEQLSRHRTLLNIFDKAPVLDKDVFVAPSAAVIGDVQIGKGSSVWYGSVLRGDVNSIRVGSGTNIQDNSLVHVAKTNLGGKVLPTIIGDNVTVGIFVGGSKVVHFRPDRNFKSITETSSNFDDPTPTPCPTFPDCGFRQPNSGVVLSCLDCFLRNGSLYCFDYGVSPTVFLTRIRGGTCTTALPDPPETD